MFTLLFSVLVAGLVAFFATQNTSQVSLHFAGYVLTGIPLYGIVIVTLLFGLIIAGIINLLNSISAGLALHGKDRNISQAQTTILSLKKEVENLRLENETLKGDKKVIREQTAQEIADVKAAHPKPPLLSNISGPFAK